MAAALLLLLQLQDDRRDKVWMVVPILVAFLKACCVQGRLPACVSSALINPAHKRGAVAAGHTSGTADYRCIAVGSACTGCIL